MLPMNCYYFRFDALTQSDGTVIYAPPNFSNGNSYFFGYDLSQYVINYQISRDVDNLLDGFNITIDKYFFSNPYNTANLSATKATDIKNTFQPTVNHVIVIGALPASFTSGSTTANMGNSYNYDDNELFNSPLVGMVTNYVDDNAGHTVITCVSLMKVLNDFTLGTDFNINDTDDRVNQLQIYYDYNPDPQQSSSPYFPPIDPSTYNITTSRYKILLAEESNIDDIPQFPSFSFITPNGTITRSGYESPKIAWRLLQEVGWCRLQYGTEVINNLGVINSPSSFINPYQVFNIPESNFNDKTMVQIGQNSQIMFKAYDTDGLRYDYTYVGDLDSDIQYSESYNQSFDPSKQSILYNLKTLAEADGNYLYLTCCPRIEQASGQNFPNIVWDASVYGEGGNSDIWGNLSKWGIYAGFRPKVMMRQNPKFENIVPERQLYYGLFNDNPLDSDTSAVMAQTAQWTSDNENTINKLQIKYGQTIDGNENYVEVPALSPQPAFYSIVFTGSVVNSPVTVDLHLLLGTQYTNQFELTRSYGLGVTASEIVEDLFNSYTGSDVVLSYGIDTIIISASSVTATMVAYWNSQIDPTSVFSVSLNYTGVAGTDLSYVLQYMGVEPYYFGQARLYQKEFGIKTTKVSLPELASLVDVYRIADKLFQKLAQPKYRLSSAVNNIGGSQLPLFEYFEVIDTSNTKQVFNSVGPEIDILISGNATGDGHLTIAIPSPYVQTPQIFNILISNGQSADTIKTNAYNAYYPNHPLLTSIYTPTMVITATSIELHYGTEVAFGYNDAFDYASASSTATGIKVNKNVKSYNMFVKATYDEYLLLLNYTASSDKSMHLCTFGLPNETLDNILNQVTNWVADVEKST
jgi:hypothetical protein